MEKILMHVRNLVAVLVAVASGLCGVASAADEAHQQDEQAIRAAAQQYVEALERGDVATLESLWAPGGEIVDAVGVVVPAEQMIDQLKPAAGADNAQPGNEAADEASAPRPKMHVTETSLRFLTPEVALEDGAVEVARGSSKLPPARGRYLAVWVKSQEGKWQLASLRESRPATTTPADLAALGWMVGQWTGHVGKARFDVSAHWNAKHTFLERDLTVTHEGQVILNGRQRIGVDPIDGKIKSWMYDADGGHGEGEWTRHGDTWVVQAHGVSPDGRQTSGTNVYAPDGEERMTWKSTGGFSAGQSVPDFEIELERSGATVQ